MKRIMVILGTRPEVIKLYPVVKELKKHDDVEVCVVSTGQQIELVNQIAEALDFKIDVELGLMSPSQTLSSITSRLYQSLPLRIQEFSPDLIIVQGDTTSAVTGAITGYYHQIPIAHIEAGLRTGNLYQPFPEEGNRRMISQIARYNFAPTLQAQWNLEKENVPGKIIVTGNTGIDTLLEVAKDIQVEQKKQVLVTLHRRESFGEPLRHILQGISLFLKTCPNWRVLFPVHPNPFVHETVFDKLKDNDQIELVPPLDYLTFIKAMKESAFILTDSGGVQEEAPSLNKPVLVARDVTERPEGLDAGVACLVGTGPESVAQVMITVALNEEVYSKMTNKPNPYGDGHASERIVSSLLEI